MSGNGNRYQLLAFFSGKTLEDLLVEFHGFQNSSSMVLFTGSPGSIGSTLVAEPSDPIEYPVDVCVRVADRLPDPTVLVRDDDHRVTRQLKV